MRVLIVHNFYQQPGGEDRIVRDELSMLSGRGVEADPFAADNKDIHGLGRQVTTALQVVYNPWARRALSRRLAEFRPDLVHIHNFFPLLSPSVLDSCLGAGVPSVLTLHNYRILFPSGLMPDGDQARHQRHWSWRTISEGSYRGSSLATLPVAAMIGFHQWRGTWRHKVGRFVALTDWARARFVERGIPVERIVVKPNWVARPNVISGLRRDGALFVGRLDAQKGIDVLLRAWTGVDYPLRIIGEGPLRDLVTRYRNGRITCLGHQPREAVQKEMQAARFMVLPSSGNEMFPMTLLEAFANRLPVICSDLPSLDGLIETGRTGIKFAARNAGALAERVRWAIANPAVLDAIGQNAYRLYMARYTPEANFEQLMTIYRAVRNDNAGARAIPGQASR